MINTYAEVLKKYAQFTGRSRRKEYWEFFLANIIISVILTALGLIPNTGYALTALAGLYSLAVMLPGLAICIRRLHDIDKP